MLVFVALLIALNGGTFASTDDTGSGLPDHPAPIVQPVAFDTGSGLPDRH